MRPAITQETGPRAVCGMPLADSIEVERPTIMGDITPWDWILDLKKKLSQAMQSLCLCFLTGDSCFESAALIPLP